MGRCADGRFANIRWQGQRIEDDGSALYRQDFRTRFEWSKEERKPAGRLRYRISKRHSRQLEPAPIGIAVRQGPRVEEQGLAPIWARGMAVID